MDALLKSVPDIVTHIISVLGGVLPALGIAMLMAIVIKEKLHLIFFFAGFVLLAFAKLSMIALVFIAALVAYLVYLSSQNTAQVASAAVGSATTNAAQSSSTTDQAILDDTEDWFEDEDLF